MFGCGRKICICRKQVLNFYMKYPKLPAKEWKDKLKKLKKNKSRCSGTYAVMVNNLEKVDEPWKY